MDLWKSVCKTDTSWLKNVKFGKREFKSIDPYKQLQRATELWGPFGCKWGVIDEKYDVLGKGLVMYTAVLFYPFNGLECRVPIHSDINFLTSTGKVMDDWTKKLATDAITKGLSMVGFNADVFLGQHDNKYNNQG